MQISLHDVAGQVLRVACRAPRASRQSASPSVRLEIFAATSRNAEAQGHLPQHCLELAGIDAVGLHHGLDDWVGKDFLQDRFATAVVHRQQRQDGQDHKLRQRGRHA